MKFWPWGMRNFILRVFYKNENYEIFHLDFLNENNNPQSNASFFIPQIFSKLRTFSNQKAGQRFVPSREKIMKSVRASTGTQ